MECDEKGSKESYKEVWNSRYALPKGMVPQAFHPATYSILKTLLRVPGISREDTATITSLKGDLMFAYNAMDYANFEQVAPPRFKAAYKKLLELQKREPFATIMKARSPFHSAGVCRRSLVVDKRDKVTKKVYPCSFSIGHFFQLLKEETGGLDRLFVVFSGFGDFLNLGSYPMYPSRIYELTLKVHFKFLLMFAKQMDDSWCGIIPTYEAIEACLTVELTTLKESWKIICKPSEAEIEAMGTAHDASVDAKMTLDIFWVSWRYRVKYAHFFDAHCRLRIAPKKVYQLLTRHVSDSEKVVLKKVVNDLEFEKALFMKRNYCAFNCQHPPNDQIRECAMFQDMKEMDFAEKILEEYSDDRDPTLAGPPSRDITIEEVSGGDNGENSTDADSSLGRVSSNAGRIALEPENIESDEDGEVVEEMETSQDSSQITDNSEEINGDRFQYTSVVPPVLSPLKRREETQEEKEANEVSKKRTWISSAVVSTQVKDVRNIPEYAACNDPYSKDEQEASYRKLQAIFVQVNTKRDSDDDSSDSECGVAERRVEPPSPGISKKSFKRMRSIVEVSPRGSARYRQELIDDDNNMDLSGSDRFGSVRSKIVACTPVPSPFMKLKVDKKASYASELDENNLPLTGQIATFDANSLIENEKKEQEKEIQVQSRRPDWTVEPDPVPILFPYITNKERAEADEEDWQADLQGYEDPRQDTRDFNQYQLDCMNGNNPFVPSIVGSRGTFDRRTYDRHVRKTWKHNSRYSVSRAISPRKPWKMQVKET